MNSIRIRVLLSAIAVTVTMLVLAGLSQLTLLRDGLVRQLDQQLLTAASGLTQAFEIQGKETVFDWEGIKEGLPLVFVAIDEKGRLLARSSGKRQISRELLDGNSFEQTSSRTTNATLSDGSAARVVTLRFQPHVETEEESGQDATNTSSPIRTDISLFVGGSLDEVNTVTQLAKWRLLWVTMLASGLSAIILWPVTGFVVRPINKMARQISTLDAHQLEGSVDEPDCPVELLPVTLRLNEFIKRLADAFKREKETTANIAHELRTPLAGLVATLELAASKPRSIQYYQQMLVSCMKIGGELQSLVEQVLLLSRLDAGSILVNREVVDVGSMLKETWEQVLALDRNTEHSINWNIPVPVQCHVDPTCLRQIFRNLLSNALTHGVARQPILVSVEEAECGCVIEVTNLCDDISQDDIPRLKERFFQIDENRGCTGQNAGLGLAIADHLATLVGGKLILKISDQAQFIATLRLP